MDRKLRDKPETAELRIKPVVLRQKKERLSKNEETFRFLAENSMDALWKLDLQFRFTYVSPSIMDILGFRSEEVIGRSLFSILTPESGDSVRAEYAKRMPLQERNQIWGGSTYTVEAIHKDGRHIGWKLR